MAAKRKTGRGSIAPVKDTIFFHDVSGNLNEAKEPLFFQTWGLDMLARKCWTMPKPDPSYYPAYDHGQRWSITTILTPEAIVTPNAGALTWEEIRELRSQLGVEEGWWS